MDPPGEDSQDVQSVESLLKTLTIGKKRYIKKSRLSHNPFRLKRKCFRRNNKRKLYLKYTIRTTKSPSTANKLQNSTRRDDSERFSAKDESALISGITEKMAKIWNDAGYRNLGIQNVMKTKNVKQSTLSSQESKQVSTNVSNDIPENYAPKQSCARQAMSDYCDSSVTELAAYLEETLFIPKDMSFMAEMMYT